MKETLDSYLRRRCADLGMSASELCRRAQISRQTLHTLSAGEATLPTLPTVMALARVLQVHPLRLLQIICDEQPQAHTSPKRAGRMRDQSAFVRDVSFPDGALVLPKQRFTKTWEVQNVGSVPWEDRFMQCQDEEIVVYTRSGETLRVAQALKPDMDRVPVPYTAPGDSALISIHFTAPGSPGSVLSYWKSVFADGSLCFPRATGLWVKIRVSSLATAASEARA